MARNIPITRQRLDDYLIKFKVKLDLTGRTFLLTVDDQATVAGVIEEAVDSNGYGTVSFDPTVSSPINLTELAADTYHYSAVMTTSGRERTLCHGAWVVEER